MTRPRQRSLLSRLVRRGDEAGVAMITAIMVMMILTGLGATIAVVGINNLRNANHDRQAGSSLGAGDAGVAQAIEYLRNNGVTSLSCQETAGQPAASCNSNPAGWSNPSSPQKVSLDNAALGCTTGTSNCAKVWIGTVTPFSPPGTKFGIYNIHSEGVYGPAP